MAAARKGAAAPQAGPTRKPWGLMVYIAGDNDLSNSGLKDIQEMCREGASDEVHVAVEIDTHGEHTGSIRYEITPRDWTNTGHRVVIERLSEKDTGDPRTFREFLQWGLGRYPAKRQVLVVWGHGTGFRSVRRNVSYDDFGSSLDMPEIEGVLKDCGYGPGNRLAILAFDACLMSMIEISHHFEQQVEVIVGSQQTEPGDGWPYDEVLYEIKRATDPHQLASRIVEVYIRSYRRKTVHNVTQSAIRLRKTPAAIKALSELGRLLAANIDEVSPRMRALRSELQAFYMADYVDLVHLARLIRRESFSPQITRKAEMLVQRCRQCVISSRSFGEATRRANGMSVWYPPYQSLYYNYRPKYLELYCNRDPRTAGWLQFLDALHH